MFVEFPLLGSIVLMSIAAGVALLSSFLLGERIHYLRNSNLQPRTFPLWMLIGFLLYQFLYLSHQVGLDAFESCIPNFLVGLPIPLQAFVGVFLWLYVRSKTEDTPPTRRDVLKHCTVPMAAILTFLPVTMLSKSEKISLLQFESDGANFLQMAAGVGMALSILIAISSLIIYALLSWRRLSTHREQILHNNSEIAELRLSWVSILIILIFVFVGLSVLDLVTTEAFGFALLEDVTDGLYELLLTWHIAVFGIRQEWRPSLGSGNGAPNPDEGDKISPAIDVKTSYVKSALTEADLARISLTLDAIMEDQSLWRNPLLGLTDLAKATRIGPNHISETLNTHLGKNFYQYVNEWRINGACEQLINTDRTILEICLDVGFNSKSTFNNAFKKLKGQTPSAFRAENKLTLPSKGNDKLKRY